MATIDERWTAVRLVEVLLRPSMPLRSALREAQQAAAKAMTITADASEAQRNDARHAVVLALSALLHSGTEERKREALEAAENWLRHIPLD
jgi:hypothetical protein